MWTAHVVFSQVYDLTRQVSSRCFKGYNGLNEMNKIEWNNRSEILRRPCLFHTYYYDFWWEIYIYILINNDHCIVYPNIPCACQLLIIMHASISVFQRILYIPRIGCCGSLILPAAAIWPFQRGRSWWHHSRQKIMAIWWHVRGKFILFYTQNTRKILVQKYST